MDNSSNDYWLVYPASHIAVFDAETQTWSLFEDHRGKTVYDTTTGNPIY
ncbi:phage tail protein, partial [Salmonella enterica subsp. enterica serovar Newport]|nr:phage tail protein [Salmonella enterica subsp. enterica serovar Newport]